MDERTQFLRNNLPSRIIKKKENVYLKDFSDG